MTTTTTSPTTLLDAELIRRQRVALGLSEREVAKRLGVTGQVVASLERGRNHDDLPLSLVTTLAGLLALPLQVLLTRPAPEATPQAGPTRNGHDTGSEADTRVVGALLAAEPTLVPVLTLAQVLGWESDRVLAALEALEPLLEAVGRRLHRLGGDVKVTGDATVVEVSLLTELARRSFARRGMSLSQARLLRRAWLGELTGAEHGNADRVAIGDLMNAGLLETLAAEPYNGHADLPALAALGLVGADMLKRAGMNVDVQATDWGSVIQRRASKEPVEKGGWSVFFTSFFGLDQFTPATHLGLRANGAAGWFGWCDSPKLEALREEWLRAPDLPAQQAVAARIQEQAFSDVPYLPLGEYSIPTATRKEVSGVLKGLPLFWGLQKS